MSLFNATQSLIAQNNIATILEIGSGHGDNSTQFLIRGLEQVNNPKKKLYCIEAKPQQFNNLVNNTAKYNFVVCLNKSSITDKSFLVRDFNKDMWDSPYNKIAASGNFPRELVQTWFDEESAIIRDTTEGVLDTIMPDQYFDMVVIDGSEFTGYSEYQLIKDRCKYLVLDDVHKCFKNYQVYDEIKNNGKWNIIFDEPNDRNGTVIAVRK
jgi:hypothetical protein